MATQDDVRVQCAATHEMLSDLFQSAALSKRIRRFALPSLKVFLAVGLCTISLAAVSAAAMTIAPRIVTPKQRADVRLYNRKIRGVATSFQSGSVAKVSAPKQGTGAQMVLSGALVRAQIQKAHGKGFIAIAAKLGTGRLLHDAAPDHSTYKTGMYLTGGSTGRDDFRQQTEDAIKAAGGNAMVIEVKGGNIYFQSTSPMAQKFGTITPVYDLPAVVSEAHAKGIYVIARFVALNDAPLAEADSATQIRNPVTGVSVGDVWTDPGAADTLEYNREIIDDILKSGIDELNLDYIRFPTEYAQSSIGLTTDEKEAHLEKFIQMARNEIDAISPSTKLGISTYAILGWDFQVNDDAIGQNFIRFAPLLDIISPMAYPDSFKDPSYYDPSKDGDSRAYYLVSHTLKGYDKLLGPEESKKIRPWLQAYFFSPDEIRDEIKAVYDTGHCGFTFWNANNNYGPAYQGLADAAGDRPTQCKD